MSTLRGRLCAVFVATWPLCACSLMGLDDFGAEPCVNDGDCVQAKQQLWPKTCGPAVCNVQTGLCEWHEPQEVCNGRDDDCDGLIDEGLTLPAQMLGSSVADEPAIVGYATASTSTSEPVQTYVAVVTSDRSAAGFTLGADSSTYELEYDSLLAPGDCPKVLEQQPQRTTGPMKCNFAEVALADDGENLIVASINTRGCAVGQLRVGVSDIKKSPFKVYLGPSMGVRVEDGSDVGFGVDLVEGCTGPAGATRPAVASLGPEAGALLVWLGASARVGDVPDDRIPVEALGLAKRAGDDHAWLDGANGGAPTPLGYSTDLSAPAVLAVKSPSGAGEYWVAFPTRNADGKPGIQLLSVPAAGVSGFEVRTFLDVGTATHVSLSVGNVAKNEVGIAWFDGTQSESRLRFRVLSTVEEEQSRATSVSITPASPFAPQLLFQRAGFANTEPRGGWFLSWIEAVGGGRQMFHVARVRDGEPEDAGQSQLPVAGVPLLFPNRADSSDEDPAVGYAWVEPSLTGRKPETQVRWCE